MKAKEAGDDTNIIGDMLRVPETEFKEFKEHKGRPVLAHRGS